MWSGYGNLAAASGDGLVFVALAMQRVAAPDGHRGQWRRVAVVGLPSGQLTWATLMSKQEGYLKLSEPRAPASAGELQALQAKLPTLLAAWRTVDGVATRLKTLVEPAGPPAVLPLSAVGKCIHPCMHMYGQGVYGQGAHGPGMYRG